MIFAIVLYLAGVALIVLVLHAAMKRPNELLEPLVPSERTAFRDHQEVKEGSVAAGEPQGKSAKSHPEMAFH